MTLKEVTDTAPPSPVPEPKSRPLAANCTRSVDDLVAFMSAEIEDLSNGSLSRGVADSTTRKVNAILKAVEMKHRYGSGRDGGEKTLLLREQADGSFARAETSEVRRSAIAKLTDEERKALGVA